MDGFWFGLALVIAFGMYIGSCDRDTRTRVEMLDRFLTHIERMAEAGVLSKEEYKAEMGKLTKAINETKE